MDNYSFGYPRQCSKCTSLLGDATELPEPYYANHPGDKRVMLIGQDPHIYRESNGVKTVLMLNENKGQLSRWLHEIFGKDVFDALTLYATNLVKCPVKRQSYPGLNRMLALLRPYFNNCRGYLIEEVTKFKPTLVLTFGEPAHKLFIEVLDQYDFKGKGSMKNAFTGQLDEVSVNGFEFSYSPCLHIKTYRVADHYGDKVKAFKDTLRNNLTKI